MAYLAAENLGVYTCFMGVGDVGVAAVVWGIADEADVIAQGFPAPLGEVCVGVVPFIAVYQALFPGGVMEKTLICLETDRVDNDGTALSGFRFASSDKISVVAVFYLHLEQLIGPTAGSKKNEDNGGNRGLGFFQAF